MKVLILEAHNRAGRIAALDARSRHLSHAASLAYDHDGTDDGSRMAKFVQLSQRASKAASIHDKFKRLSTPVHAGTRRKRLAQLLKTARSSIGARGGYEKGARALMAYQRHRYQNVNTAARILTPGRIKHDPSSHVVTTRSSWEPHSKRVPPLHVQQQGTKRVHLPHPPSEHPALAAARAMHTRVGKRADQSAQKFGVNPRHPHAREIKRQMQRDALHKFFGHAFSLPAAPKDKSHRLPATATWEPAIKRIRKPVIRRAVVRRDPSALRTWGPHPMATLVRRPIGPREIRQQRRFEK